MIVELGEYVHAVEALRLAVWFRATILCEGLIKVECPGENKEKKQLTTKNN